MQNGMRLDCRVKPNLDLGFSSKKKWNGSEFRWERDIELKWRPFFIFCCLFVLNTNPVSWTGKDHGKRQFPCFLILLSSEYTHSVLPSRVIYLPSQLLLTHRLVPLVYDLLHSSAPWALLSSRHFSRCLDCSFHPDSTWWYGILSC